MAGRGLDDVSIEVESMLDTVASLCRVGTSAAPRAVIAFVGHIDIAGRSVVVKDVEIAVGGVFGVRRLFECLAGR